MRVSDVSEIGAGVQKGQAVQGTPYGEQLRHRALADPNAVGLVVVARDGSEEALSWDQLERQATQWGRTLANAGAKVGSMVALAIPNSVELVLSTLGCWKIGAVPIPMRWDLPDWERTLGVRATQRNWNTTTRLRDLLR